MALRSTLISVLVVVALVACSSDPEPAPPRAAEGQLCSPTELCADGLVCSSRSAGSTCAVPNRRYRACERHDTFCTCGSNEGAPAADLTPYSVVCNEASAPKSMVAHCCESEGNNFCSCTNRQWRCTTLNDGGCYCSRSSSLPTPDQLPACAKSQERPTCCKRTVTGINFPPDHSCSCSKTACKADETQVDSCTDAPPYECAKGQKLVTSCSEGK